jgi:hypothetical protein
MIMADELNPYAPPRVIDQDGSPQPDPLIALRGPSLGLWLLSIFGCFGGVMIVFALVISVIDGSMPSWEEQVAFAVGLLSAASCVVVLRGATSMRRGTNYRGALIGAVLSCIPVLSPLIYLGIPFGIWALIVLRRPAVRAAFTS